jgi:hypothetical protein
MIVSEYLVKLGWTKDRQVDIEPYLKAFKEEKLEPLPNVLEFLKSYGDLKDYPAFDFDVVKALGGRDMRWIEDYEKTAGVPLSPIGEAYTEHMILLMDSRERIYGGYDDAFCLIGNNLEEFFGKILGKKEQYKRTEYAK